MNDSAQSDVLTSSEAPGGSSPVPSPAPLPEKKSSLGKILSFIIVFLLICGLIGVVWMVKKNNVSAPTQASIPLKHIRVQLSWFNTAEFAGFFIAQEKGFYKQAGLTVSLMEANPPQTAQDVIISGKADFGVTGIDGIMLAREKGYPVKALAAIYQQSPATFITLQSSGIVKPQDFVGKRVTIECGTNVEYQQRAVLKRLGLDKKIIENCSTYSIDQLLSGKTDVFAGFVTNESILLAMQGHPVNNILVTDYGVNYYANLIFASEKFIASDPKTIKAFITATLKGYDYALAHPEEAVAATMKQKSSQGPLSIDLQRKTMAVQSPLIYTGKTPLGWMDQTVMSQGIQILLEQGIIKKAENPQNVYTNAYVSSQ